MQISSSLTSFYGLSAASASSLGQTLAASGGQTSAVAAAATAADAAQSAASDDASGSSDPSQFFLNYMKETPAQRMQDAWLTAHHLTRQQLDAMLPDQRQAIERQMANDIENQIKKQAEQQQQSKTDILAGLSIDGSG